MTQSLISLVSLCLTGGYYFALYNTIIHSLRFIQFHHIVNLNCIRVNYTAQPRNTITSSPEQDVPT